METDGLQIVFRTNMAVGKKYIVKFCFHSVCTMLHCLYNRKRTKKGKQNGAIFILKRQMNINMSCNQIITKEYLECGQSQESVHAKVVAPLYHTSAGRFKHTHFCFHDARYANTLTAK